ncbi:MAG: flagellar biosynthesis regulator FlaF [Alphaproteobacteria bacterium]
MTYTKTLSTTENDAAALVKSAYLLASAKDSGNPTAMATALDENLRLWIGIKSLVANKRHSLPNDIKQNLVKLADFIAQKTFEYGVEMPESTLKTFINSNLQISEGLLAPIQLSVVEKDSLALLKCAFDLSNAKKENDLKALTIALDNNLKLWVIIRTVVKSPNCELPEDTKLNLIKLSEFTAQKTFELSNQMNERSIDVLINNNLNIAEGLLTGSNMNPAEQDAMVLVKAAVELTSARDRKDKGALVQALDSNLQIWVGIKTAAKRKENPLSSEIKQNLIKLADFVAQKTFELGENMNDTTLDTIINANLQISEGLLEKRNCKLN